MKIKNENKILETFMINLPAKPKYVSLLVDFLRLLLEKEDIKRDIIEDIILSIDEVFTNVVMHTEPASDKKNPIYVMIRIDILKNGVYFIISDPGEKWDYHIPEPELKIDMTGKKKGGFGLYIIKKLMDGVDYKRRDKKNHVILFKNIKNK